MNDKNSFPGLVLGKVHSKGEQVRPEDQKPDGSYITNMMKTVKDTSPPKQTLRRMSKEQAKELGFDTETATNLYMQPYSIPLKQVK